MRVKLLLEKDRTEESTIQEVTGGVISVHVPCLELQGKICSLVPDKKLF